MAELELIGAPRSNFVWTTRIGLTEMGVPYTHSPAAPHTDEVFVIHPLGIIPAMRHGDVTLFESPAILTYAHQALGGRSLISDDAAIAARDEQWRSFAHTLADRVIMRTYAMAYIFPGTADGSPNRAMIDEVLPKFTSHLDMLDGAAKAGEIGRAKLSIADIYLLPMLAYASQLPEGGELVAARPALAAYLKAGLAQPSVAATAPPPPQ
ncbi:MAG: glutathione S-transferase family protein [Pseudomonadota bacterium]